MMSIHLLSDIDGVAFDWFKGFAEYMVDKGEFYTGAQPTRFDMTDVFPFNKAPYKSIEDYQASPFYVDAPLYQEVRSAMQTLKNAQIPVTFITSCGDHDEICRTRREYFTKHLGGLYDDIIFLPYGNNKFSTLSSFDDPNTHYLMVDDQALVCEMALENGITAILKDMPYNQSETRFMRAENYTQVANYAIALKNKLSTPSAEYDLPRNAGMTLHR